MKILITGGTGFLGKILTESFLQQGYIVDTLARGNRATLKVNLSFEVPQLSKDYDLVIHAAGKAHSIPKLKIEKDEFFEVNVNGTSNLLKSLEGHVNPNSNFVFISSVAVYGQEEGNLINEHAPLRGDTPYAKSKIEAEQLIQKWCLEHKVHNLIFRLPLIAGPNPIGNLGAMIRAIQKGFYVRIGKGETKKSVVMASDLADVILKNLTKTGIYNLTDNHNPTITELEDLILEQLNKSKPISIPYPVISNLARIGDVFGKFSPINSLKLKKLVSNLTFSCEKAIEELNWTPNQVIKSFKIK